MAARRAGSGPEIHARPDTMEFELCDEKLTVVFRTFQVVISEEISLYFGVIDELATLRICKYFMILAQKKKGQYKFYCRIG